MLSSFSRVLEQTCLNQVKKLQPQTATELVSAMLRAMTENSGYEPVVQMGASAVLVAIGHELLDLVSVEKFSNFYLYVQEIVKVHLFFIYFIWNPNTTYAIFDTI